MPLAIAVPSAAAPLRRPHHFRFLQPSRKLSLSRTRCASSLPAETQPAPPQPRRYPRQYPGEAVGVAEEIRFVAMRLRNTKRSTRKGNNRADGVEEDDESEEEVEDNEEMDEEGNDEVKEEEGEDNHEVEEWMPSMEGFVRYLVDSKLVFDTVERIIAGSTDVAYVYFRKLDHHLLLRTPYYKQATPMSTVISCTLLSGRPAAPSSSAGSRVPPTGKAAAVALSCFQRQSRPSSVCFASNPKGEQYGPKTDLPPFSISPVALVHPVSPREERWQMEEEADAVSMWFEVPGLSKEDLVVELDEDVLIIRRRAKDELYIAGLEKREATNTYRAGKAETAAATAEVGAGASYKGSSASYKVEASRNRADAAGAVAQDGGIYARLLVPAGYSKESVEAELASGVLRVTIGKVKEYARRKINVDIHVK